MTTKDKHGIVQILPRVEVDKAQEILGTWMCPKDNGKRQVAALVKKVKRWVKGARVSKMLPGLTWVALTTRIMKGIEWPLVATLLTENQCKEIITPLLKAGLRDARIQWKISRDILYSLMECMGMQFPNIYTTMGIQKMRYLVDNGCKDHLSGHLIRQTHERLTLEMGLPGEVLNWEYKDWGGAIRNQDMDLDLLETDV